MRKKKNENQPLRKSKVRYIRKKNMKTNLLALLFIFFISCGDDAEPVDFVSLNDEEIQDYLVENDLQAEKTTSGLYYIIDSEGSGVQPTRTDQVRVAYKGYFTNANVFDQSPSEGISFNLQQVIGGWTEGITYFKEGGSGMLVVPSHLGYGSQDYKGIPGGSVLIFEINLIEVNGSAN
jgi:FKBP-type peptidyl-prolyl cis-trans isomerase FkpA